MIKPAKQLRGFSLLELLLVLIVMGAMLFTGLNRYQLYRQNKDISAAQQNVQLLAQALNTYYQLNCHANQGQNFTVTINDLKQANLFPNFFNTAIVKDYNVAAKYIGQTQTTKKPIYQLLIMATLNVPISTMPWYQQKLDATSFNDKQLIWIHLPSYGIPTTVDGLGILNAGAREFKEITAGNNDQSCT